MIKTKNEEMQANKNETNLVHPFEILVEIFECEFFHTY